MVSASRAYLACRRLFSEYPLAVSAVDHVPTMHTMVLMLRDSEDVRFFVLLRIRGDGRPAYTLSPWRAEGAVKIAADGGEVPGVAADAVTRGVPIPQDGAMFGGMHQETVTALLVVYARYTPDWPVPAWSVMPLVGIPKAQWAPFARERFFGTWFWGHYSAGNIIDLNGLIAANPDTVFWADTYQALGSDCCVVTTDIKTPEGRILRSGQYLDAAILEAGGARLLTGLLAVANMTDLASRFQAPARSEI
jgi:hypothetical protein